MEDIRHTLKMEAFVGNPLLSKAKRTSMKSTSIFARCTLIFDTNIYSEDPNSLRDAYDD